MPRFYFHVCNGTGFVQDEIGQDLPHSEAARLAAIERAREIMASDVQRGMLDLSSFIEIENDSRQLVQTICFDEAVDTTKRHRGTEKRDGSSSGAAPP